MVNKNAVRAGVITVGTTLMLLMSTPAALAARPDDGDDPGAGLSIAETVGLYVAAPVLLYLLIAGLTMLGDKSRDNN